MYLGDNEAVLFATWRTTPLCARWSIIRRPAKLRWEIAWRFSSMPKPWSSCPRRSWVTNWLRRYDLNPANGVVLILLWLFFLVFMIYPLGHVFSNAFFTPDGFSLAFIRLMFSSPNYTIILANSVNLGLAVTLFATLLSLPLAFFLVRYNFPGKGLLNGLILSSDSASAVRWRHRHASVAGAFRIRQLVAAAVRDNRPTHRLARRRQFLGCGDPRVAAPLPDPVFESGGRAGERRPQSRGSGKKSGSEWFQTFPHGYLSRWCFPVILPGRSSYLFGPSPTSARRWYLSIAT